MAAHHKVEVRNIPSDIDEAWIDDVLFENILQGGEVMNIEKQDNTAIITLNTSIVARDLIDKGKIEFDGTTLDIGRYEPTIATRDVLVQNVPSKAKAKLKLFLKRKHIMPGGADIKFLPDNTAVVSFQNIKDAGELVRKRTIDFEGEKLMVSFYRQQPEDPTVFMTGVPKDFDRDYLMDLLEEIPVLEKGVVIRNIELMTETEAATVTFQNQSDASKLLELKSYEFDDIHLQFSTKVQSHPIPTPRQASRSSGHENDTNTNKKQILVRNIPESVSKDYIEMFFESSKVDGGPVADVECDEQDATAIITFDECSDAQRMVDKSKVLMKGTEVAIEWYEPKPVQKSDYDETRTIEVSGIPTGVEKDYLMMYFEGTRQKGGVIDKMEYDPEADTAIVCFEDRSVAERMVDSGTMTCRGTDIAIKWYESKSADSAMNEEDDRTIMVTHLPPNISKDFIEMYFESSRQEGGPVTNLRYDVDANEAVVTFESSEDAKRMVAQGEMKMKGANICIQWYQTKQADSGSMRSIFVSGLPASTDKEVIEMYFESRRQEGGAVDSIEHDSEAGTAVVTFEDGSVAEHMVNKKEMQMKKHTLTIDWHKNKPKTPMKTKSKETKKKETAHSSEFSLEVTNIHKNCKQEHVALYFESVQCGGSEISEMSYNQREGRAIIDYVKASTARAVVDKHKKGPLVLSGHAVEVKLIDKKSIGKHLFTANSCAIEITDLPQIDESLLKEALELVFENPTLTNKEAIEDTFISRDLSRATVTYKTPKVAEFVLGQHHTTPLEVEEQQVKVTIMPALSANPVSDDKMEEKKLCMKNLPDVIRNQDIKNYMQLCVDEEIELITYSQQPGDALITFTSPPDFIKLFEHICMKPLRGNMVTPMRVPQSRMLEVYGIYKPSIISSSKIKLYFERTKLGGGKVQDVTVDKEMDCAIVTFEKVQGARNALKVENHEIQGRKVNVKLHCECIGLLPDWFDSSQPPVNDPKEAYVQFGSKSIIQFVFKSPSNKAKLEQALEALSAEIDWPNIDKLSSETLLVKCTLDEDSSEYNTLAASWQNDVTTCVKGHLTKFSESEVPVPKKYIEDIDAYVQKIYGTNMDEVMVMLMKEGHNPIALAVGLKAEVDLAQEDINKELQNIKKKRENKQRLKSVEVANLSSQQLKYLRMIDFDKAVEKNYEECSVNIDTDNSKLTFHGTDQDNEKAKREMEGLVRDLKVKRQTFSSEIIRMFRKEEVLQFAQSELKKAGLARVTVCVSDETLDLMCNDESLLKDAIKLLVECVCDKSLPIDEDAVLTIKSALWKNTQEQLEEKYSKKLTLMECASVIRIIATRDIVDDVFGEIEAFFKAETVTPEFIHTDRSVAKLVDRLGDLPELKKRFPDVSVKIQAEIGAANPGITLRFISSVSPGDVDKIREMITTLAVTERHVIRYPGMPDYFLNERSGQSARKNIESEHHVVIEIEDELTTTTEDEDAGGVPTQRKDIVSITLDNGAALDLLQGDILQQNSDAVMVPIAKDLSPLKGPGLRVLQAAGETVQKETRRLNPRNVKTGQCFITSAGNLDFDHIVHSVFPVQNEDEQILEDCLTDLWKATDNNKIRSIALPGCMFDKYSSALTARVLRETLSKSKRMKDIYIVAENKSTVVTLRRIASALSPDYSKTEDYLGFASPVKHKEALYEETECTGTICTREGINVALVIGEIAKQKVDVIVNTANHDFNLKIGAVSESILRAAGSAIQTECNKVVKRSDFSPDTIVETGGGALRCRKIYHMSLVPWGPGDHRIKQALTTKLNSCLEKAMKSRHKSLAFPAIGTGNLGYPLEYVAKVMYEGIHRFSKKNPKSGIRDIKLVIYHMDEKIIAKFEEISNEICEPGYFGLPSDKAPDARPKTTRKTSQVYRTIKKVPSVLQNVKKKSLDTHDIQISGVRIQLKQGDITKEQTDAIVNSSDFNLSMDSQLSRAIVIAGGSSIEAECAKQRGRIRDVIITGAGCMDCQHIIHIAAPEVDSEWKQRVIATLLLAENRQLRSIAFPALGTGALNISAPIMVDIFMDAIATFVASNKFTTVETIRFVIFDEEMMDTFKTEMKKIVDSDRDRGYSMVAKIKVDRRRKKRGTAQVIPRQQSLSSESESENVPDQLIDTMVPNIVKSVTMKITGFSMDSVTSAIDEVERVCNDECREQEIPVSDAEIFKDGEQRDAIQNLENIHAVSIAVDDDRSYVRIKGRAQEAAIVYKKATDILREAEKATALQKQQETTYQTTRWQFYNAQIKDYEDYPKDINYKVEMAQQAQHDYVEWTEEDDQTFRIDFRNMQEYPLGNRSKAIDVRKYSPAELDLPSTWEKMNPRENSASFELSLKKREGEMVLNKISRSMSNTNYMKKLVSIHRVQNKSLYRNYMINKTTVEMANPSTKLYERHLWHGTTVDAEEGITAHGFNRAHAYHNESVSNYGKGVYFAVEAEEAHNYTFRKNKKAPKNKIHLMYYCRVLTGEYTEGRQSMMEPPVKDSETQKKYDSVVDNEHDPHIFVVFYDALAYPEYLIKYECSTCKTPVTSDDEEYVPENTRKGTPVTESSEEESDTVEAEGLNNVAEKDDSSETSDDHHADSEVAEKGDSNETRQDQDVDSESGPQSSKAKLLSRIAKMGQPMLPGMSGGQGETVPEHTAESDAESSKAKLVSRIAKMGRAMLPGMSDKKVGVEKVPAITAEVKEKASSSKTREDHDFDFPASGGEVLDVKAIKDRVLLGKKCAKGRSKPTPAKRRSISATSTEVEMTDDR